MDDKEIFELFSNINKDHLKDNRAVKEVFSTLIRSTLRYRDHILKSTGTIVTVKDVRIALDWLVPSLKTGRLPETDNKISLDLLKLWLDEFKTLNAKPGTWDH